MARLVLHFDVNETIMVGDPAGGDSFEESLNKIVSKSAIVRLMLHGICACPAEAELLCCMSGAPAGRN